MEQDAVFVGLAEEHRAFEQAMGWSIPHYQTESMLDVAEVIAGADMFIGNQSQCLALAIGLGVHVNCERRVDLPIERNECYFPNHHSIGYFV
jgi:hypothetical protein